jgi:outer membrane lipoprotein
MRRQLLIFLVSLICLSACAPVFREEVMKNSTLNPELDKLSATPAAFEGKTYILGGRIIDVRTTEEGVVLEAMCLPVDYLGYIDIADKYRGRFLAIRPKGKGLLDPLVFAPGRDVTIAGIYKGLKTGMIGDLEFSYSYFEIVEIRLWEPTYYYDYPYYTPYPSEFFWYSPWWHHHHHHPKH